MIKKNKKYNIHPDFKYVEYAIPFNNIMLASSHIAFKIIDKVNKEPDDIYKFTIKLKGYKGLYFNAEVIRPKNIKDKRPCILYAHGGGFGYEAAPYHKELLREYVRRTGCVIISPDYHLLPKYPYPAALKDMFAAYKWIIKYADFLNIDINKIILAGDSAGGALTANLCNILYTGKLQKPCMQMLIYPVLDIEMKTKSMKKYVDTPLWNAKNNKIMWDMYLQNLSEKEKYKASPMHHKLSKELPYTYIEVAEYDCLRDEGIAYANKLKKLGIKVELYQTKGTIHGYDINLNSGITRRSIYKRIDAINRALKDMEEEN